MIWFHFAAIPRLVFSDLRERERERESPIVLQGPRGFSVRTRGTPASRAVASIPSNPSVILCPEGKGAWATTADEWNFAQMLVGACTRSRGSALRRNENNWVRLWVPNYVANERPLPASPSCPRTTPPPLVKYVAARLLQDLEAYVMDASAINAPFLLSKLANHNRPSTTTATSEDPSSPPTEARRGDAPIEGGAAPPPGGGGPASAAAEDMHGPPAFDAVFTNAALHWVRAPRTVIEGAKRVLRPGGRCVSCACDSRRAALV